GCRSRSSTWRTRGWPAGTGPRSYWSGPTSTWPGAARAATLPRSCGRRSASPAGEPDADVLQPVGRALGEHPHGLAVQPGQDQPAPPAAGDRVPLLDRQQQPAAVARPDRHHRRVGLPHGLHGEGLAGGQVADADMVHLGVLELDPRVERHPPPVRRYPRLLRLADLLEPAGGVPDERLERRFGLQIGRQPYPVLRVLVEG